MSHLPDIGIVAKFGGKPMEPANLRRVLEIASGEDRSIITASANFGVTDHLVEFTRSGNPGHLEPVYATFRDAASEIGGRAVRLVADEAIEDLAGLKHDDRHNVLASGERFSGQLLATALDVPYVEVMQLGCDDPSDIDTEATSRNLRAARMISSKIVAAAFFAKTPDGRTITLGRNMSDGSGAIFTNLSGSKMYENWKDVLGIFEADPGRVPNAKKLSDITYTETREAGGKFLHRNAVLWLEHMGITTHLRPTTHPNQDGTFITDERDVGQRELLRTIAAAPNMRYFRIHQTGMNESHGVIDKITQFFDEHGLSVNHLPSGIDTIAIVADNSQFGDKEGQVNLEMFYEQLRASLPENVSLSTKHVALAYLVGHGIEQNGNLAHVEYRRSGALIKAKIPILGSEAQPENPMAFVMVPPESIDDAIRVLHGAFFGQSPNIYQRFNSLLHSVRRAIPVVYV